MLETLANISDIISALILGGGVIYLININQNQKIRDVGDNATINYNVAEQVSINSQDEINQNNETD